MREETICPLVSFVIVFVFVYYNIYIENRCFSLENVTNGVGKFASVVLRCQIIVLRTFITFPFLFHVMGKLHDSQLDFCVL